jgi:hypothetical protein
LENLKTLRWILIELGKLLERISKFLPKGVWVSVSQLPGLGLALDPVINYTSPRDVLLEFVILVFQAFFTNKYFIVEIF